MRHGHDQLADGLVADRFVVCRFVWMNKIQTKTDSHRVTPSGCGQDTSAGRGATDRQVNV